MMTEYSVMSIGNGQLGEIAAGGGDDLAQTLHCMHDQQAIMCYSKVSRPTAPGGVGERWDEREVSSTLNLFDNSDTRAVDVVCYENHANDSRITESNEVSPLISSRCGTGGNNLPLVQTVYRLDALSSNSLKSSNPNSGCHLDEVAKTLDTTPPNPAKNQGGQVVVALDGDKIGKKERKGGSGLGVSTDNVMHTQTVKDVHAVAYPLDLRNATRDAEKRDEMNRQGVGIGNDGDPIGSLSASQVPGVATATVRRLLPIECERLMGFPDNWTRIPWRGKPEEECPDSPRYKACGNSMCVNVMRWIGMRIEQVERKNK